jgi:hypothetical protein
MNQNPLTREFKGKLAKLDGFAGLVEDTLVARSAALDADLSARAENFAEEERREFFEFHAEDYFELADELPTILRYAVLTAADTALEVYLNDTCETFAEVHNASVRLADFGGIGIERARKYLKKLARVPFPDERPSWISVVRLHELRNCIIHADGIVAVSRNELRQWSDSMAGLRITENGTISLSREFAKTALTFYERFAADFDEACGVLDLWQSVFPTESV